MGQATNVCPPFLQIIPLAETSLAHVSLSYLTFCDMTSLLNPMDVSTKSERRRMVHQDQNRLLLWICKNSWTIAEEAMVMEGMGG
jgi:hypothetical protein